MTSPRFVFWKNGPSRSPDFHSHAPSGPRPDRRAVRAQKVWARQTEINRAGWLFGLWKRWGDSELK